MICGYLACTFDLLNVGDLDVIEQARRLCDRLTVGVYSDDLVALRKGLPPVIPLAERAAMLRHVRGVDAVVVHQDNSANSAALADLRFVVDGDPVADVSGTDYVRITASRTTASREVREALAPRLESGVA